jgi:polar amino acid transport system substrate-binding protein
MRNGVAATARMVLERLDAPIALGNGCAGTVLEVAAGVSEFRPGDAVACAGGGYATHSEIIFVPANLCVKLPRYRAPEPGGREAIGFDHAAFATLGAIALQGIRQSEATVGDTVAVLGLGLVGLLTAQILQAAGCRVVGVDPDPARVQLASECGAQFAVIGGKLEERAELDAAIARATRGRGVDAVIITAATPSNDPIALAGSVCRDRGRVVIVGAVGMDAPRDLYYEREIEIRFSRSYGPGRYDPSYEEQGVDYPIGYVRWTERRNMEAFLDLLAERKLDLDKLITHRFSIEQAETAYDLLTGKTPGPYVAILLTYSEPGARATENLLKPVPLPAVTQRGRVSLGLIGAGSFARSVLLPALRDLPDASLRAVAAASGPSAEHTGRRYGFQYATCDYRQVIADAEVHAVIIATRHNLHARLVTEALQAGKHVLVEKPLCLTESELQEIIAAHSAAQQRGGTCLMVGFNRRFAPLVKTAQAHLRERGGPMLVQYRVNAGNLPASHWTQSAEEGGGRILGEVCHFVDLVGYLVGARPTRVFAQAANADTVVVTLGYDDGSVGSIQYVSLGHPDLPKERLEIFAGGDCAVIDDFRRAEWFSQRGGRKSLGGSRQDKGHRAELAAFVQAVAAGGASPVPFDEAVRSTVTTFRVLDSLATGRAVELT